MESEESFGNKLRDLANESESDWLEKVKLTFGQIAFEASPTQQSSPSERPRLTLIPDSTL